MGGLPGLVGLLVGAAAVYWRIKVPQLGIDYLQRELEVHRKEIAEADRDRVALREEVRATRDEMLEVRADYLYALADREKCRRHVRHLERQLRSLGHDPVTGEEDRH